MCPDVIRGPFSRVFFPTETFQKCDSQQGFFSPGFESIFELHDERSSALLMSCERAQQQTNDPGYSLNFQHMQCDIPRLNEIDTGWMTEVLEDLPVISQEITQLPGGEVSPFSNYASFNPPLTLSLELLSSEVVDRQNNQQPSPTCPTVGQAAFDIKHAATISPDSKHSALSDASALSPPSQQCAATAAAPKPLKARGSKRSDRGHQKTRGMPKWAREVSFAPSEQVEHVLRERQRRDDMSCKIAILEGLLPPCPKRDRASIVHDSVQYVKSLQQGVEELQKKLVALKRNSSTPKTTNSTTQINVLRQRTKAGSPSSPSTGPTVDTSAQNSDTVAPKLFYLVEFHVQLEGCSEAAKLTRCKCRSDYLSSTMRALEQLNVEVARCSVTKMFDHFICVIVVKLRSSAVAAPTSTSIAASLQTAVAF